VPHITLRAEAKSEERPNVAYFTFGVVNDAPTAEQAAADNAAPSEAVIEAVKAMGVDPKDLQSQSFSVSPAKATFAAIRRPEPRSRAFIARVPVDAAPSRAELKSAADLDPRDPQAQYYLGSVLLKLNNVDGGIEALNRAVYLNPYDAASHTALAEALARAGNNQSSERERNEAGRLKELERNAGQSRVLLGSAVEHLQSGAVDSALEELRQAVELSPDYPDVHFQLARALLRKGSHDGEAIQELRRAIELKNDDAQPHLELGLALERASQKAEALSEFRRAAELGPSLAEAHRELAKAAVASRDWQSVIVESAAILAWNPTDAQAKKDVQLAKQHAGRR